MRKVFALLIGIVVAAAVEAQVTVGARLDSVQFFVGQQDGLTLQVTCPHDAKVKWPDIRKGSMLSPEIEVVDVAGGDTVEIDGRNLQMTQRYIITVWDSTLCMVPRLEVVVNGQKYQTNPIGLKVLTLDVDTVHVDQFFPPRDIQDVPFVWDDWKGVTGSGVLILVLCAVALYLWYRIRTGKPFIRLVRRKKKLPAHVVAINEIENLKQDRTLAQEDSKEYYTRLTDTLRTYIQERYGFSAMEMTSTEIIGRLVSEGDEKSLNELREIFTTADLVKFAKWSTHINENDANLMAALEYVNDTKIEVDPNAQPEPEVVKETDRERMTQVIVMRVVIGVCIVAGVIAFAWIAWRLWDLLS